MLYGVQPTRRNGMEPGSQLSSLVPPPRSLRAPCGKNPTKPRTNKKWVKNGVIFYKHTNQRKGRKRKMNTIKRRRNEHNNLCSGAAEPPSVELNSINFFSKASAFPNCSKKT
jgi:hypothetical protein